MIKNIFFFVSLTIVNTISSQNYHMRVRIVDANEIQNAINGAYVEVEQLGLVKETDKFGNVGFDDVPQGRVTINVTKPNYKKTTEFRFHVSPEEKNNIFEIQLKKIDIETKNTKETPIIINQTGHIVTAQSVTIENSPVNNTIVQKVETAGFSMLIDSIYFNNKKYDPWIVGVDRILYPLEIDSLLGRCKEVYYTSATRTK